MKKISFLVLALCIATVAVSSHLRCGYITAKPLNCSSREYAITLTIYTNTTSEVRVGEDGILNFGDGTALLTVPAVNITPRPDLGPNIGIAQYTIHHAYSNLGTFLISYTEPNRNGGVLNMNDSFYTLFYVESSILISTTYGCTETLEFLAPAILQAASGTPLTYSLGAASAADNLLTYELAVPFRDRGTPVVGYISPGNLSINYMTGLLTWDTNFQGSSSTPGEYNFAIQVNQYRKSGETYIRTGFTRIDFQVIVQGDVLDPVVIQDDQLLDNYNRLLVEQDEEKEIRIFFEKDESSTLQAFSELAGNEAFSFETQEEDGVLVGILTLKPGADVIREHPYLITIRAKTGVLGSDINYLIYTEEIPALPVITAIEKEVSEVSVYPNPVSDKIIVKLNSPGTSVLTLFNLHGQALRSISFEGQAEVSLAGFPSGIYMCDIRRNNLRIQKIKLIKK